MRVVLDSGGVSWLAARTPLAAAAYAELRAQAEEPLLVPSVVLVECLTGRGSRDAPAHRLLKACEVLTDVAAVLARRAARLRTLAGRGSAVDALVVACAEPGGAVVTSDVDDLAALAAHAVDVDVLPV